MKVKLFAPPWGSAALTEEAEEAIRIIGKDVWKDACIRFAAQREAKSSQGKSAPKGMQKFINEILKENFSAAGWDGEAGYFVKNKTWIRITFRHQMSLGSDIIDAMKVCKVEGMELAIILAADEETLKVISPNDASSIISFEKLGMEILSLANVVDIPLLIGELRPKSSPPSGIEESLKQNRPRDKYMPNVNELWILKANSML